MGSIFKEIYNWGIYIETEKGSFHNLLHFLIVFGRLAVVPLSLQIPPIIDLFKYRSHLPYFWSYFSLEPQELGPLGTRTLDRPGAPGPPFPDFLSDSNISAL